MSVKTSTDITVMSTLAAVNEQAAFNRWAGFEVASAKPGEVELRMPWRDEVGQYSGFLHAGLIGALIDTVCGFAAGTVSGQVLASQFSVRCIAPAKGRMFIAKGRVVKAGKRQVFTAAELYCETPGSGEMTLCATGDAIFVPLGELQERPV
ncbi:PaaI family thioesterase [Metapseudomonas otitidis]|uniref:PaaI family thioesterase n=1 Tax=Metapseudomonas otitidis TaxID=319939 RepID=UPI00227C3764|nr:PaaI family thioesterase [Pseudomonas otitidis]WAF83811.1 PaaI family thioesterase [Pseudomonas otitidis]